MRAKSRKRTKAKPLETAEAGPLERPGAGPPEFTLPSAAEPVAAARRDEKLGAVALIYVIIASIFFSRKEWFDAAYWSVMAFFFIVIGEPRGRVPKLVRYLAIAAVVALSVVKLVLLILGGDGR